MTTYDPSIAAYDQPRVPTPEEEPDADVRWQIAQRIPADRLERVPTLAQEPSRLARWEVAYRIPADRLKRVPTAEQEPNDWVRWEIARRIPAERLDRMPTPDEEPDEVVRWRIAYRIPADRLERVPTEEEEPSRSVRREIALRIREEADRTLTTTGHTVAHDAQKQQGRATMIESIEADGQHWKRVEPVPFAWVLYRRWDFEDGWHEERICRDTSESERVASWLKSLGFESRVVPLYKEAEDG